MALSPLYLIHYKQMNSAIQCQIHGRVQGVFYRATAQSIAQSLNLVGWVKNNADGSVSAHIEGSESDIQAFLEWAKKGPKNAVVQQVHQQVTPCEHFNQFEVRY